MFCACFFWWLLVWGSFPSRHIPHSVPRQHLNGRFLTKKQLYRKPSLGSLFRVSALCKSCPTTRGTIQKRPVVASIYPHTSLPPGREALLATNQGKQLPECEQGENSCALLGLYRPSFGCAPGQGSSQGSWDTPATTGAAALFPSLGRGWACPGASLSYRGQRGRALPRHLGCARPAAPPREPRIPSALRARPAGIHLGRPRPLATAAAPPSLAGPWKHRERLRAMAGWLCRRPWGLRAGLLRLTLGVLPVRAIPAGLIHTQLPGLGLLALQHSVVPRRFHSEVKGISSCCYSQFASAGEQVVSVNKIMNGKDFFSSF